MAGRSGPKVLCWCKIGYGSGAFGGETAEVARGVEMKIRGVVKGRIIELADTTNLPEGQQVEIEVQAVEKSKMDKNLVLFMRLEDCMEAEQFRKWALIHDEEFVGTYDTSQEAEEVAARLFRNEPCLIRQYGVHPRVYYRPTTYTPVPREFFDQMEIAVVNADD